MARKFQYESSGVGSILPLAILGGIGYLAYKNWGSISSQITSLLPSIVPNPAAAAATVDHSTSASDQATSTGPTIVHTTNPNPPSDSGSTYAKMSRWINQNLDWYTQHQGMATFDEWNFIRGQVGEENREAIEDIFPTKDRSSLMTLQEYYNGLTSKGVSGLRSLSGIGRIVDIDAFLESTRTLRRGNFR